MEFFYFVLAVLFSPLWLIGTVMELVGLMLQSPSVEAMKRSNDLDW